MPPIYDRTTMKKHEVKESPIKNFLKSCLELMEDETTLDKLHILVDQCTKEPKVNTTHTP